MQKAIRTAALARNQAKRKARITADKERHDEIRAFIQERTRYNRIFLDDAKNERLSRREDWLRGPLAPRRDTGDRMAKFGTSPSYRLNIPKLPKEKRRKHINLLAGDRVCIMKGKDKGKIGYVTNLDPETEHVTIKDLNLYDIEYPDFAISKESDRRPFRPTPVPMPIDDVRLVVPLDDPKTGAVKDVLVKNLYAAGPYLEREYGLEIPRHTRYIAGLDVEVPWPTSSPEEHQDEEVDTLRIDVEEKSWVPSLTEAPFPLSVIDELRNKYSKYRVRHDPEWVEKKQREDYYREWRQNRQLFTPKKELLERQLEEKKKAMESMKDESGNLKISQETASFIEQFMAKQAGKNANA